MTRKLLEDLGLEKDTIDKIMAENGNDIERVKKTEQARFETERGQLNEQISNLQGQLNTRDTDLSNLNEQLTAAQADAGKLTAAQTALTDLQTKYETEKKDWEARTAKQAYEYAVKTATGRLNFTSTAARREFERGVIEKGLQMEGDKILGFDDYVTAYKDSDPGAFVVDPEPEPNPGPTPRIVLPTGGKNPTPDGNAFSFHFNGVRPAPKE